jgi:hypothetical protein
VIRRKPKRQCRICLSMKKNQPVCTGGKKSPFPSPLKPAMVTEASKSQQSLLSHPGPPHLSADMYGGRPTEAHAWGHRRRRVRNEYTNCKTSFVRVSHCKKTERCERLPVPWDVGHPNLGIQGAEYRFGQVLRLEKRLGSQRQGQ